MGALQIHYLNIISGVPQGSVLGPCLFLAYDLPNSIKRKVRLFADDTTVEPVSNDHPHQRPSLLYDHISCDGQCFLFVRSLTDDHPSNATSDRVRWIVPSRGRPHRIFQNDCGMNGRCRAAHFTYHFNRWQY